MDLDPDLAALEALGGFFVLRVGAGPATSLPSLAQAYANRPSEDHGNPVTFRVEKVAAALRAPEARIAASVAQQGLAARLWSVALGCAARYDAIPDLAPERLRWDPDAGAPDDLWLTEVSALPADPATVADVVLHGHLEPFATALRAHHRLAPGLLRGNAASALAGAARQLEQWARLHGDERTAARTRSLTAALLAHPLLAGALTADLRRRSCCLYYRVPGGGVCGDCCFTRTPRSSARGASG
ncbi:(2Fe-2S)-binding protein [Streptomyces sp. NPDC101152]|uniref:(2Fe-2S)-binding protein n=1 Tax=Streptomyces sp. NPDC101152 TaxID=3366116 RepID=UPI0037F6C2A9